MSANTFLKKITNQLEKCNIPYMLSGSIASSFYGDPRTTLDIDIIIHCTKEQISPFIELVEKDAYISSEAAISALQNKSMFNVIDYQTGWKADLIVRKDRAFSIEEFSRRRKETVFDTEVFIVSPEDSILSKLEWAKKGQLEKQYLDLFSVASIKRDILDFEYIKKWAKELGVLSILEKLLSDLENLTTD